MSVIEISKYPEFKIPVTELKNIQQRIGTDLDFNLI